MSPFVLADVARDESGRESIRIQPTREMRDVQRGSRRC